MRLKFKIVLSIVLVMLILFVSALYVRMAGDESIESSKNKLSTELVSVNKQISDDKLSTNSKISSIATFINQADTIKNSLCHQDNNNPISFTLKFTNVCKEKGATLNQIIDTSNTLHRVLQADNYLSKLLNQKAKSDSIHDLTELWTGVAKQFGEYKVPEIIAEEKLALSSTINSYAVSWAALDKADSDQDESAFKSARDDIYATHAQITKHDKIFHDQVKTITSRLNEQIRLFNS